MRRHELQYISDTILIESLASDPALLKEAGLFDDLGFSSIASSIQNFLKKHINADAPGGHVGGVLNILTPGILYRIHPVLGIAAGVSTALGFNIGSIFGKVKDAVKAAGGRLSLDEADAIAKDAVGLKSTASIPLEELIVEGRKRRWSVPGRKPDIPFGRGAKGASMLTKIFGNLGKLRGKMLLAGILIWFIKTFLLAAGLIAGASLVAGLVTKDKDVPEPASEKKVETPAPAPAPATPGATYKQQPVQKKTPTYSLAPQEAAPFEPSGRGQKFFANNAGNLWIVPLINRSIDDTLVQWTIDVYPETELWSGLIESAKGFKQAVRRLKRNYTRQSPNSLIMPQEFHTRRQVVDLFSKDIEKAVT
jgi:hypothetical protein